VLDRLRAPWKPKTVSVVALALMFLCGAVVGALLLDLVVHSRSRTPSFETVPGRVAYFDRLKQDLDLTPEQSVQVRSILEDFWQYYRTVLGDSRQQIEIILTHEQRAKFAHMLQAPPR
jgi:hypothetical protein